jgi:hypothetical protein
MIKQRKPLYKRYLYGRINFKKVAMATRYFTSKIKYILKYDYSNVTPDERILIQKLSGNIEPEMEKISAECINYLEESIKNNNEEMIEYNFRGFFLELNLLELGSISIILAKNYLELQEKYGNFQKFISEDVI